MWYRKCAMQWRIQDFPGLCSFRWILAVLHRAGVNATIAKLWEKQSRHHELVQKSGKREGGNPKRGCVNLIVGIFCHKLHEDERNWTDRRSVSLASSPIGSANAMNIVLCNEKSRYIGIVSQNAPIRYVVWIANQWLVEQHNFFS